MQSTSKNLSFKNLKSIALLLNDAKFLPKSNVNLIENLCVKPYDVVQYVDERSRMSLHLVSVRDLPHTYSCTLPVFEAPKFYFAIIFISYSLCLSLYIDTHYPDSMFLLLLFSRGNFFVCF
jgi:hypothetical protein